MFSSSTVYEQGHVLVLSCWVLSFEQESMLSPLCLSLTAAAPVPQSACVCLSAVDGILEGAVFLVCMQFAAKGGYTPCVELMTWPSVCGLEVVLYTDIYAPLLLPPCARLWLNCHGPRDSA